MVNESDIGNIPKHNPYGDEIRSVLTGFGSDVSSQRTEPFEKTMLQRAKRRIKYGNKERVALDLFSGYFAANALRLARIGYTTYAFDFSPPHKSLVKVTGKTLRGGGSLHYFQQDVRKANFEFVHGRIDLLTCQRGIHFLPFVEAKDLIARVESQSTNRAVMFFSIGAVDCKVGHGYKHQDLPVEERWHPLEKHLGEPIHVTEPLCLYKENEIELLFAGLRGKIASIRRDDFGLFLVEFRRKRS